MTKIKIECKKCGYINTISVKKINIEPYLKKEYEFNKNIIEKIIIEICNNCV